MHESPSSDLYTWKWSKTKDRWLYIQGTNFNIKWAKLLSISVGSSHIIASSLINIRLLTLLTNSSKNIQQKKALHIKFILLHTDHVSTWTPWSTTPGYQEKMKARVFCPCKAHGKVTEDLSREINEVKWFETCNAWWLGGPPVAKCVFCDGGQS